MIGQMTESVTIDAERQRVDRKITPIQVVPERSPLNRRQGAGGFVIFQAGAGHVNLAAIGQNQHRRAELPVAPHPAAIAPGEAFREENAISFNGDIYIQIINPQQQVAHKTADRIDRQPKTVSDRTQFVQDLTGFR